MKPNYARPGMQPFALLAFAVQRIARAVGTIPGVDRELLRIADADAMLVLEACGIDLPPKLKAIARRRHEERARAGTRPLSDKPPVGRTRKSRDA